MTPNSSPEADRRVRLVWGFALVVLVVFAVWRAGGFDLTSTLENGRTVPNMYGTVDHPFHASRGATLLESIRDGEILRWMGNHQGGYPVEFYPLGLAWLDVILWGLLFGSVPILAVHKLTVSLILVLPALAYWLLVRGDKLHPSIAFLAMAFHLAIPGYWLNGGYEELVGWGLVTNVAGSTLAVVSTVLLARYVLYRQHWAGVCAVISIAAGAVSNPRSLFGIVFASLAIAVWSLITSRDVSLKRRLIDLVTAIGVVGGLAFLIAAPIIMALLRYNSDYFFLHYEFYDPLSMFWDALRTALSPPILLMAIGGGLCVFLIRSAGRMLVSQVIAVTTVLYSLFTIWVARSENRPPLVEQLEAPRLMPFQRLLMFALAAILIVVVIQLVTAKMRMIWREAVIALVALTIGVGSLVFMSNRPDDVPDNKTALYPVSTVGDQRFADLEDAVTLANDVRPEGTSVFVIGNEQDWWHEQLWAPGIVDGTYYYDDWLWYWHQYQPGPYNQTQGYYMPNPTDALTEDYFAEHGIGAVMVSDMWVPSGIPPKQAAATNELLEHKGNFGIWDVYLVKTPNSIATRDEVLPSQVSWSNERIELSFDEGSGPVTVRQNWFPRWQAEVNGESVPISRTESGYMTIELPDGPVELTLTYDVTGLDWTARAMSVLGFVGLTAYAFRGNKLRSTPGKEVPNEPTIQ